MSDPRVLSSRSASQCQPESTEKPSLLWPYSPLQINLPSYFSSGPVDNLALPYSFASMSLQLQDSNNAEARQGPLISSITSTSTASSGVGEDPAEPLDYRSASKKSNKGHVIHSYTDYSDVPEDFQGYGTAQKRNTGGVLTTFPEKLHQLLAENKFPDVISWLPHGRSFLVHKTKDFESCVMGSYFTHTKITSFQRQLNLYGFKRITKGADRGSYYHEYFLRWMPKLCARMRRQKVKGTGTKPLPDPENEPNFYTMKPLTPPIKTEEPGTQKARVSTSNESNDNASSKSESDKLSKINLSALNTSAFSKVTVKPDSVISQERKVAATVSRNASTWANKRTEFNALQLVGQEMSKNPIRRRSALKHDVLKIAEFADNASPGEIQRTTNDSAGGRNVVRRQSIEFARQLWVGTYNTLLPPNQDTTWTEKVGISDCARSEAIQPYKNESDDAGKLDRRRYVEFAQEMWIGNGKHDSCENANRGSGVARRRSTRASITSIDSEQFMSNEFKRERRSSISRGGVRRLSQKRLSITSLGSFNRQLLGSEGKTGGRRSSLMSLGSSASFDFDEDIADAFSKRMSLVSVGSSLFNFKKELEEHGASEYKAHSDGSCAWREDGILNRRHSMLTDLDYDNLFDDSDVASV